MILSEYGLEVIREAFFGGIYPEIVVRLYFNNIPPNKSKDRKQFKDLGVYEYEVLNKPEIKVLFNLDSVGEIYGHYITSNGIWIAAEKFIDGPYISETKNDILEIEVNFELKECEQ